jgi:hypothetical protein
VNINVKLILKSEKHLPVVSAGGAGSPCQLLAYYSETVVVMVSEGFLPIV